MTRAASTLVEDVFAFGNERISGDSDIYFGRNFVWRIGVGDKSLGTERFLLFQLLGELLSSARLMVIDLTLDAQEHHAKHNTGNGQRGNGAAPDLALEAPIKKRHQKEGGSEKAGNYDHANDHRGTFPEF